MQCVSQREHGIVHYDQLARWVNVKWMRQEEMCRDLTEPWPHQGDPKDLFWVTVGANSTGEYDNYQNFGPVANFMDTALVQDMVIVEKQLGHVPWEEDCGRGVGWLLQFPEEPGRGERKQHDGQLWKGTPPPPLPPRHWPTKG